MCRVYPNHHGTTRRRRRRWPGRGLPVACHVLLLDDASSTTAVVTPPPQRPEGFTTRCFRSVSGVRPCPGSRRCSSAPPRTRTRVLSQQDADAVDPLAYVYRRSADPN